MAFTYNDPVIWAEYAIDTASACRERGIKTVAVTAGYITPDARKRVLRGDGRRQRRPERLYRGVLPEVLAAHLQPVLDTLAGSSTKAEVWFEITNLIIPQANDEPGELRRMCEWIAEEPGSDVPCTSRPSTPTSG